MKYRKYEGIIINRRLVGEADRFFTILTFEAGKLDVFARSVRSLKSKRSGTLDLFNKIKFELIEQHGRRTLTHVELLDNYQAGKKQLTDISRLFALGELVDALVPVEDPQENIYTLLDQALTHLPRFATPLYLLRFKKKLLHNLGFWNPALSDADVDRYIESLISRALRAKMFQ